MARRHRRRGRHSFKIPVISLAILAGQLAYAGAGSAPPLEVAKNFQSYYTGFIPGVGFEPRALAVGYGPWLVKGLVRKVARPLGALPKIPFGLPISLS